MTDLRPDRYAAIFADLDDGAVVADTSRAIRYVNPAFERIFGYSNAELDGQRSKVLYAAEEDFVRVGEERFHQGASVQHDKYRVYYRRKDGSVFASETVTAILRDDDGAQVGYLAIIRDITDRLAVEEQAAIAARMLEDAVASIGDGFALYDAEDRLVVFNEQYRSLYPRSAPAMQPGITFRTLLKYGLDNGEYDTGGLTDEQWLEERLRRHRAPESLRVEQRLRDGRWLQIRERRTRDGGIAGVRADVTSLKAAQQELADALCDLRILTNSLPCMIAAIAPDGRCTFINDIGAQWLGSTPVQLLGQRLRDLFDPDEIAATRPRLKDALRGCRRRFELRITFPDRMQRDAAVDYIPKFGPEGQVQGLFIFVTDISDQKNVARTLKRLYDITSSRDYDSGQKIDMILEAGCDHFNLPLGIVSRIADDEYTVLHARSPNGEIQDGAVFPLGQTYCVHTLGSDEPLSVPHAARSQLRNHPCYEAFGLETYIGAPLLVDGERFGTINFTSAEARAAPFSPADHEIIKQFADWIGHELARDRDLAQLQQVQAELERLASTDELTGVLNRRELLRRAEAEFERARRYGDPMSLLMLDVDHFKSINDQYGHATGDVVLKSLAAEVGGELRPMDSFGRMGGEEFAIVVSRAPADRAFTVAERIRERVRASCAIDNGDREVTVSIGVASVQLNDASVAGIMERADRALYTAKEMGRNQTCVFPWEQQTRLAGRR